jgi:hypothetical protein
MILNHKSRIKFIFYDLFSQYKKTDEINQSVFSETSKLHIIIGYLIIHHFYHDSIYFRLILLNSLEDYY